MSACYHCGAEAERAHSVKSLKGVLLDPAPTRDGPLALILGYTRPWLATDGDLGRPRRTPHRMRVVGRDGEMTIGTCPALKHA